MIIHFTTVHLRTDTRIRLKEVATLARVWPGVVALFVQDGKGDEVDAGSNLQIRGIGVPERGRLRRMTFGAYRMYRAVRRARPKVAHFHDPELLPWAVLLRLSGIVVIYDAHEDLPAAIMSKPYIRPGIRRAVAAWVELVEGALARLCQNVVAATPTIARNFATLGPEVIQNFPLLKELQVDEVSPTGSALPHFAYVGGLAQIRGAIEMVKAVDLISNQDVRLQVAGNFPTALGKVLETTPGWRRVDFHGWANRVTVAQILSRCKAGLVVFHPEPNHVRAQPNKMFEYMAAGIPVIASDFPLWREIVDGAKCGLLVDPQDPQAIAKAMEWIIDHPGEAAEMGRRGRNAIEERYNWEAESHKLIAFYQRLIPSN